MQKASTTLLKYLIFLYLGFRLVFFFNMDVSVEFRILAALFLFAEFFILIHGLGYFNYLDIVAKHEDENASSFSRSVTLSEYPPVAIVVASYKEPLKVLEDTLVCFHNLTYPNKHLYFLDDTRYDQPWETPEKREEYRKAVEKLCAETQINVFRRTWHHAKAGMINDFLDFLNGSQNPDYSLIKNEGKTNNVKEKYLIIFDADMNPFPDFVEPLVAKMEKDATLGFIQTPQYYTNFDENRVAKAASLMQVIFYEYICEGKGLKNVVIFCGTNVILRIKALEEVGGLDCSSVTEDFATAFNLHTRKWKSLYTNKVCAFGLGPEDLGAFFQQQYRWALGTVGLLPKLLKTFLTNPFKYSFVIWWEYFLSSSYYLIGWIYLILLLGPVCYIFFDFPIYYFPPLLYAALLIPYNILSSFLFYSTLCRRGYLFKDLFAGVTLGIVSTPIYMMASAQALLGIKGKFLVTPKGEWQALPLLHLWPQILIALLSFSTCIWAVLRIYNEQAHIWGLAINFVWSAYYFAVFSSVFYFNQPRKQVASTPVQQDSQAYASG